MNKPVIRGPQARAGQLNEPWFDENLNPTGLSDSAMGGGLEGAERFSREMISWNPSMSSPDMIINRAKPMADARGRDQASNDGYTSGAVAIHKDSIIGAQYLLTSQPDTTVLKSASNAGPSAPKFDDVWQKEASDVIEARFNLMAESEECYFDVEGLNTFTGMMRLGIGGYVWTGEVLASSEWDKDSRRPVKTCFRMISPSRLCNENNMPDTDTLRRGVEKDAKGRPFQYHIRNGYPNDPYGKTFKWDKVQARTKWGRRLIMHVMEPREPGQSRGIADIVSALKLSHMRKHWSELTLQNAAVQASYAAAVESELPPDAVRAMMGGNTSEQNYMGALSQFMESLQSYVGASNGIKIDGVKIPHLFPGTKLTAKPLGTPGGVGTDFEASLLRHLAAALGVSYEEFSRDFSRTSYISARASMSTTGRFMRARKKLVADRFANQMFQNVLEEEIANGNIPMPVGVHREYFYLPLMKDAFSRCTWTGSGVGQIDELKETQAAILRINSGLSTYQDEAAKFGKDYLKTFEQRGREIKEMKDNGLEVSMNAEKKSSGASTQGNMKDKQAKKDKKNGE